MKLRLTVNGEGREVEAAEDATLLLVLRNDLGLKGTRFGCGEEACGSCMVLVDGEPVFSCTARAQQVQGRAIETVEGLSRTPQGRRLVDAFLAEQAGQCGYCLSGILMSAKALLDRTPAPSEAEIAGALEPHLCRCGSHGRILRAVKRAAA